MNDRGVALKVLRSAMERIKLLLLRCRLAFL